MAGLLQQLTDLILGAPDDRVLPKQYDWHKHYNSDWYKEECRKHAANHSMKGKPGYAGKQPVVKIGTPKYTPEEARNAMMSKEETMRQKEHSRRGIEKKIIYMPLLSYVLICPVSDASPFLYSVRHL
ncbi:hypothetical protein HDV00_001531 [Rhizophlyctis rosea]|nr:hypothetical protein HDV00_001531 [Rhizophlyctis rosea]